MSMLMLWCCLPGVSNKVIHDLIAETWNFEVGQMGRDDYYVYDDHGKPINSRDHQDHRRVRDGGGRRDKGRDYHHSKPTIKKDSVARDRREHHRGEPQDGHRGHHSSGGSLQIDDFVEYLVGPDLIKSSKIRPTRGLPPPHSYAPSSVLQSVHSETPSSSKERIPRIKDIDRRAFKGQSTAYIERPQGKPETIARVRAYIDGVEKARDKEELFEDKAMSDHLSRRRNH
ncbi:hypothetical protein BofuT4_P078510.1 [Botrytis cinerea T4]|uniref:Uncharacterized protein n=1 Tax=Botryotinia fuckeliana (strain T4) TaxID=999810 RepID=G2YL38_BOTF4|nr:hypothetical protein BofuT4_P078510.1 [Botrytis cinerea T4]